MSTPVDVPLVWAPDAPSADADLAERVPPPGWRDPAVVGEPGWVAALWAWQAVEARVGPLPEPGSGGAPGPCQPVLEADGGAAGEGWCPSPWSELAVPDEWGNPSEGLDTSVVTVPEWDRQRFGAAAEPVELLGQPGLPVPAAPPDQDPHRHHRRRRRTRRADLDPALGQTLAGPTRRPPRPRRGLPRGETGRAAVLITGSKRWTRRTGHG